MAAYLTAIGDGVKARVSPHRNQCACGYQWIRRCLDIAISTHDTGVIACYRAQREGFVAGPSLMQITRDPADQTYLRVPNERALAARPRSMSLMQILQSRRSLMPPPAGSAKPAKSMPGAYPEMTFAARAGDTASACLNPWSLFTTHTFTCAPGPACGRDDRRQASPLK